MRRGCSSVRQLWASVQAVSLRACTVLPSAKATCNNSASRIKPRLAGSQARPAAALASALVVELSASPG